MIFAFNKDLPMTRHREKSCSICNQAAQVLLRCQYEMHKEWCFICQNCWQNVSQDNPFYVYGGTWKARK